MTDKEKLDAIRAEIHRLVEVRGYDREMANDLFAFMDSLPNEPVKIKKGCKYRCICNLTNNDTGNISFVAGKIYLAPKDDTLASEENGWLCDTSKDASNFELVEETVSGLDNGDMPAERWKQAVKAASNQINYRSSKRLTETRDDYFVDGVQWADEHPKEEPVSIWHYASEKPERDDLLIETNDGRIIHRQSINNYGMVKRWAYCKDILNLSNVERTGKNWKEEPKKCMYTKDDFTEEDRKILCEDCEEKCEYAKKEEPVSEDLEEVSKKYSSCTYLEEVLSDDDKEVLKERLINTFKAGAQWHKEQMMAKAIDANCFGFQNAALFSFRLPADKYLVGSKVKVIVVKED